MIKSLLQNPLAQWGLGQTRRDKRSIVIMIVFLVAFYGLAALIFMTWAASSSRVKYLANTWAGLAAVTVGILLLFWAPARVAATVAKQREEGVLDMLRMTGMSGSDLAVGHLLTQMSLPLTLAFLTSPLVLFGAFSEAGPLGAIRLTLVMALLTPIYCMLGALAGLTVKKPQTAGGAGMFAALGLLISSGIAFSMGEGFRESRILSLLGPWGQVASFDRHGNFEIQVLGTGVPGELLQVGFLLVVSAALLRAVAYRYTNQDAVFFGRRGALLILFSTCALVLAAWYPDPFPSPSRHSWRNDFLGHAPSLAFHLIIPFIALLWAAVETPVSARSFVRGKARRDRDDAPLPDEGLGIQRFAPPAGIYALMVALFMIPMALAALELGDSAGGQWNISPAGLFLGGGIALASFALLALCVQWALLATRDIGVPRLLATMVVLAFWTLPVIAGAVISAKGAPDELASLAYGVNPFFGITAAAHAGVPRPLIGFSSSSLGLYCLAVQSFAAIGVFTALKTQRERLVDHANSLVVLPADAYAAPGSLTQRCSQGHLYTDVWTSCPHCEPNADRVDRKQAPAPSPASAPPRPPERAPLEPAEPAPPPSEALTGEGRAEPRPQKQTQAALDPLAEAIRRSSLGSSLGSKDSEEDFSPEESSEDASPTREDSKDQQGREDSKDQQGGAADDLITPSTG